MYPMKFFKFLFLVVIITSCKEESDFVTDPDDYNVFLKAEAPRPTSKYFELWNSKINSDSTQLLSLGNVAGEYARFFRNTGEIAYLKKCEASLEKAVEIANINKEAYSRSLSRNYISQHRFRDALKMAKIADSIGGGKKETHSLLFDIYMELGNYGQAEKYLDSIKNMSDFGFLIRIAKWSDYKGDLNSTIRFMEKAAQKAESSNNKNLKLWSYTNLADYYGHAGLIQDSYEHYLKALALDSKNAYAKKGIAWIVYSHEKNGGEALRILDSVTNYNNSPDYYHFKAEIADYMGNLHSKEANMDMFYKALKNPDYGEMYNSQNVDYYLEKEDYEKALDLAFSEVNERPTPESYNLLACTYLKKGSHAEALNIVEKRIKGKTYEPAILLNAAHVYKANKEFEKVQLLKKELAEATYELGPTSIEEIKNL